jgi:hypothetical protein
VRVRAGQRGFRDRFPTYDGGGQRHRARGKSRPVTSTSHRGRVDFAAGCQATAGRPAACPAGWKGTRRAVSPAALPPTVSAALRYQHAAAERDKVIAEALSKLAADTVTPISRAKGGTWKRGSSAG